jgi:SulP family sulfate permease
VVVALMSALPGMIATPLAAPTALLAIVASHIAAQMVGEPEGAIWATVTMAVIATSLLTGGLLLTLGLLRWGDAIRLIPYPVVGGFMAGTGWLLVDGFVQVTSNVPLQWRTLSYLARPEIMLHWVVGLGCALILLTVSQRWQHYLVMPSTLVVLMGVFYLALWATGTSLTAAREANWLLGPFPAGGLWEPVRWSQMTQVQWSTLFSQIGAMGSIALVCLLSLILSNSGIELVVGRDLNLNVEMRSLGLACLLSGTGGGMVGSQALPSTLLVHEIGGHSRLTGIISGLPALAVLALGSAFLSYLPKPILGCLLLYLGISLLIKWVYQTWFKLPFLDYLTVIVILVTINVFGFLQGILVGFIMAVLLFMYNYSHVDVAKEVLSGATIRSNVERNVTEQDQLAKRGDQILILELQGFLFFGTANYLLNQVKNRVELHSEHALNYIVLDFRQVTGIDSSAVLSCNKILKIARQHQIKLIFTNLSPDFQHRLARGDGLEENATDCLIFPDIDRGLEWCENEILATVAPPAPRCALRLPTLLAPIFPDPEQVTHFLPYLEKRAIAATEAIYAGEYAEEQVLYFLAAGRVNVLLQLDDGNTKRMQTLEPGALIGEMRFYGKPPLSTRVIAVTDCILYGLSQSAFGSLKQEQPAIASQLERHIIQLLCDSLARREQQLRITR